MEQFLLNLLLCRDWNEGILNTTASGAIAGAATAGFFHGGRQVASRALQAIDNFISPPNSLNPQNNLLLPGSNIDDLAPGATNWRGYEFRSPNPDFPPNQGALAKMQSVNFQSFCANGNTDCGDIAVSLYKASGQQGSILHIEPNVPQYLLPQLRVPEAGGVLKSYIYHEVYTDGSYVFDPRLSPDNPIPLGDFMRLIEGLNPNGVTITQFP